MKNAKLLVKKENHEDKGTQKSCIRCAYMLNALFGDEQYIFTSK